MLAPDARDLALVIHDGAAAGTYPMPPGVEGDGRSHCGRRAAGDHYSYRINGTGQAGSASNSSLSASMGPQQVIDPDAFRWTNDAWSGPDCASSSSTSSTSERFPRRERSPERRRVSITCGTLGVTAVELMPVADFAGERNWGYDGVCLYAPSHAYGHPTSSAASSIARTPAASR